MTRRNWSILEPRSSVDHVTRTQVQVIGPSGARPNRSACLPRHEAGAAPNFGNVPIDAVGQNKPCKWREAIDIDVYHPRTGGV